jgi:hypothetical protein
MVCVDVGAQYRKDIFSSRRRKNRSVGAGPLFLAFPAPQKAKIDDFRGDFLTTDYTDCSAEEEEGTNGGWREGEPPDADPAEKGCFGRSALRWIYP